MQKIAIILLLRSIPTSPKLIILLRDGELAKKAFQDYYGKSLTRLDLEFGRTRVSHWLDIANRFSDPLVQSKENFTGRMDEINSSQKSLCYRDPSVLKEQFENVNKMVTKVVANWSKSSQNDPDNFKSFLRRNPTGGLSAESKRIYTFFIVARMETSSAVDELINCTKSTVPGSGENLEEGNLGEEPGNGDANSADRRTTSARNSGSRKELSEISRLVSRSLDICKAQTAMVKEHFEYERSSDHVKGHGGKDSSDAVESSKFDHRVKLATCLAESSVQIKRARDVQDDELVEILEENHRHVLKKFKKILKEQRLDGDCNGDMSR
ncbi:hypothetical protein FGB62_414g01 [Gracilaria domingensis]|nr:hypothetical protein FGB62_414g01 [Gracilaria domingensis]